MGFVNRLNKQASAWHPSRDCSAGTDQDGGRGAQGQQGTGTTAGPHLSHPALRPQDTLFWCETVPELSAACRAAPLQFPGFP